MIVQLDNILIYINEADNINIIYWVFHQPRKQFLYTNQKKYCYYQDEVGFLGYVIFLQDVCIKNEQINTIHDWAKLQSIRDIHIFLEFANFYNKFIKGFRQIIALLISMLRALSSPTANESIFTKDSIDKIIGGKMIVEVNSKRLRMGFLSLEARLAFAKLGKLSIHL